MLQPATSLLHCSMHHLPFCVPLNSSSSHWDGHHDSSRLCLSARMNKRCRGKAEQLYRFSLTCGEPCCQMSISLYFYLFLKKPLTCWKSLKRDPAMYHIRAGLHLRTAAKFSEELAHWMASSNSCCVDINRVENVLPLVKNAVGLID